jgi:PhnB protein
MVMSTYVNFNGTCAEAFRYYEEHLGGTIDSMMTFGELPDHSPVDPAWTDRVVHARMSLGGMALMGADIQGAEPMRSAYLTLDPETIEDAERIFAALSDRGEVFMPLREAFFATRFAQLRDRFGINWMILHQGSTAPVE